MNKRLIFVIEAVYEVCDDGVDIEGLGAALDSLKEKGTATITDVRLEPAQPPRKRGE